MDANLFVALLVIALLAVAGWLLLRRRRSETLARQFGPEYEHAVSRTGSRSKAEAELLARRQRVSKLSIVPLAPAEAERFAQAWRSLQARFVDSPQGVLLEADQLVRELMQRRGYPMGDFETRAADVSVDHPGVVDHYRAAHAIALRDQRGEADTEALRQAIVHYRALFADLLEVDARPEAQRARTEAAGRDDRAWMPRGEHAMARREERQERTPRDEPPRSAGERRR
ncbi:MAG TPA: hypothetical protein VFH35_01420 [Ramlibacter sp.]|nr:hypothetical protein [Ramlibacter sp.]